MNRCDISELHFIAPILNMPSIMHHGILSHNLACRIAHNSVDMPEIQERRRNKQIPGARTLHDYANLYFDAHNPMLSKRRARNDEICVLRVNATVLDLPGVIVSDRNAASSWVRFFPVAEGLRTIDRDRVFAQFWIHSQNPYDEMRHKSEKCAEVLIPDRVTPNYLIGAYVANDRARVSFDAQDISLPVEVRGSMFF